jgi:hypothetical protein
MALVPAPGLARGVIGLTGWVTGPVLRHLAGNLQADVRDRVPATVG